MHPIVLILLAVGVWVMGYRFYGKFIRLGILQLQEDGSAPVVSHTGDPALEPRSPLILSTFHAAASTGLLSVIGAWGRRTSPPRPR